jgi:hypothetical protein
MDRKWFESPSMEDCMEHCSRYWGKSEGCYGIVWRGDNKCWIRNSNVTVAGLQASTEDIHSAMIAQNTYAKLDTSCPGTDLSTHTLDGVPGLGYTLHCNKVIGDFDTCWSGYPRPCWDVQHVDGAFIGYFHTKTLEECVRICTDQSPLCKGVSWNPDYSIGYANCWPKTGYGNDKIVKPPTSQGIIHSVAITSLDLPDKNCPTDKTYSTTSNNNFNVNCGQTNDGTNITSVHSLNITSCMDTCATTDKCVGVVFDTTLQDGFKNCYLKNTTSTVSDRAYASFALLAGSGIPSSTPSPSSNSNAPNSSGANNKNNNSSGSSSNSDGGSTSKAWIAGPVVGGLLFLAIIAGALFWWRRRKAASAAGAGGKGPYEAASGYATGGGGHQGAAYHPVQEADPSSTRMELPATTKYAHRSGEGVVHEAP